MPLASSGQTKWYVTGLEVSELVGAESAADDALTKVEDLLLVVARMCLKETRMSVSSS